MTDNTEQKGWREELRLLAEKAIATDGGSVATKYVHLFECFIERTLTAQREEMVRRLPERTKYFSERNGLKEPRDYQKGYDDCLAAIRALIKDTKI